MSDRIKALREKRGKLVTDMRALTELAEKEKRDLTGEEVAQHEKLFKEIDALRANITAEERTIELAREEAESADKEKRAREDAAKGKPGDGSEVEKRQMTAFATWLRTRSLDGEGAKELRELQAGADVEGGYLKPPPAFIASLLKNVDDIVYIRAAATKHRVQAAQSLGVPTLDTDLGDADWTTELQTGAADTAMRFGRRELSPNPMAKQIKVSKTLMRATASGLSIVDIVMQRMAYKIGLTAEKAYLTGDGDKKPLGLFVASNDGIPTSRDVSTGNSATAIAFDGLIEAKYSVKAPYWPKADWLFHRDAVKNIVKLKDGDGQYIWRMSVRDGEPDTLLGRPLRVSEYVPNTFTSGLYVGLFGDLSYYWIADALDMQVQRLVELYAASNQDGFIARYEGDGAPVLAEAFARVKLG